MKVAVIDDDRLVVMSLTTILETDKEITVCATGEDGKDAIEIVNQYEPDILLMDIQMKKMTGIEAAKKIIEKHPNTKILFLTTFSDEEYLRAALVIGVKGYILKQDFESIIPALKAVYLGQTVFGNSMLTKLPALFSKDKEVDYQEYDINDKELELIQQVALGLSNKEIAKKLFLSEGTVRNYISVILEKLKLRDRTQLAVFYYKSRE